MVRSSSLRTIEQSQHALEAALRRLSTAQLPPELEALRFLAAPAGMDPKVSLQYGSGRQIKRTADAGYWNPAECKASISYESSLDNEGASEAPLDVAEPIRPPEQLVEPTMRDLVVALDAAQRNARFREFVGIKPFRDRFLADQNLTWSANPANRHQILVRAIDEGIVLRRSIANPKTPQFPTTAIELNREHPTVKSILETTKVNRSPFQPLPIRGESLSSSIMAERR